MMKKTLLCLFLILGLAACKKDQKKEEASASFSIENLAAKSMKNREDWTRDLDVYVDDILTCANASPIQTKYIFRADAFENPSVALILLKAEDDKVYACTIEDGQPETPKFKQIRLSPQEKSPRFYPGDLPKPDSCLNNTRILDKTGHTAGWLSKITC